MHCLQLVCVDEHIALGCQGYGVVRELEGVATEASDKPTYDCFIKECGVLEGNADLSPPLEVSPASVPHLPLPDPPYPTNPPHNPPPGFGFQPKVMLPCNQTEFKYI